jgi:hypothetical protein
MRILPPVSGAGSVRVQPRVGFRWVGVGLMATRQPEAKSPNQPLPAQPLRSGGAGDSAVVRGDAPVRRELCWGLSTSTSVILLVHPDQAPAPFPSSHNLDG